MEHFERLAAHGIKVVVNSDAHDPSTINLGRAEALRLLYQAGITDVYELHGGEWQAVPISSEYR